MKQKIESTHNVDDAGNPSGGVTTGVGFSIQWQNGPLGRDGGRIEPNGAFVEGVIDAAKDRLEFYQRSKFKCHDNALALAHLEMALQWLGMRTATREDRKVEGTYAV